MASGLADSAIRRPVWFLPNASGWFISAAASKYASLKPSFAIAVQGALKRFRSNGASSKPGPAPEIRVAAPLNLVDFRGDGLIRMGIPTDVARARSQDLGRAWSRAVWSHQAQPDGIIYDSRLNGETNVVVFDRALPKLAGHGTPRLVECRSDLAAIITAFDLAII